VQSAPMTAMGVSERSGGVISIPSRVAKKTQKPTATAAPTMVTTRLVRSLVERLTADPEQANGGC